MIKLIFINRVINKLKKYGLNAKAIVAATKKAITRKERKLL